MKLKTNNKNSYGVFCHIGKNYYMHIYIEKARLYTQMLTANFCI